MMNNEFITYGIFIKKEKFQKLTNERDWINKPSGGLWGSPIESDWSWKDWCELNEFRLDSLKFYTKWRLRNPRKILVIDRYDDLVRLTDIYGSKSYVLNFMKIKEDGYDGIMLTAKGNLECHLPITKYKDSYIDLNSWDCESIVVWNWNQIKIIETGRIYDGNSRI